jgi:hypothetical protein
MDKILRITTPQGIEHDLPDVPSTRAFYEKMNSQQKDESKKYKIEVVEVDKTDVPSAPIAPEPETQAKIAVPQMSVVPESDDTETTTDDDTETRDCESTENSNPSTPESPKRGRKPSK